jgi:hypothetical protein
MGLGIFSIFITPILAIVVLAIFLDKKSKVGYGKKLIISILFLLPFTYDIIITNILGIYYCKIASPHPKTLITKKVEYPESIYWEDNVYPGFSAEDRELMIINYLDGVHLKTMALNGRDNKRVYVYHLDKPLLSLLKKEYNESQWYSKGIHEYVKRVIKTEKIYTKKTMPKTNYTVTFNEVKLNSFARKFLYCDETKVIENNTSRVIAYNRRYMRFFYKLLPDVALGNIYYYPHALCGESYFWFTHRVFNYKPIEVTSNHKDGLNNYLYKKYIKGEK